MSYFIRTYYYPFTQCFLVYDFIHWASCLEFQLVYNLFYNPQNQNGILAMLDEECLRPGTVTDETFLDKLNTVCAEHQHFESRLSKNSKFLTDHSLPHSCFRIQHYAGKVRYQHIHAQLHCQSLDANVALAYTIICLTCVVCQWLQNSCCCLLEKSYESLVKPLDIFVKLKAITILQQIYAVLKSLHKSALVTRSSL